MELYTQTIVLMIGLGIDVIGSLTMKQGSSYPGFHSAHIMVHWQNYTKNGYPRISDRERSPELSAMNKQLLPYRHGVC